MGDCHVLLINAFLQKVAQNLKDLQFNTKFYKTICRTLSEFSWNYRWTAE